MILERILRLCSEEDEADHHLHHECPWYAAVCAGEPASDVKSYCDPAKGSKKTPKLVVKASTAHSVSGIHLGGGLLGSDSAHFPCEIQRAGGRVALTPHTAEASTVPEPTVPPGGPGLFRHKGLELPPYIQHLWHHLAPKYGKHQAYGMAVGIVKKWAAGINPGGWKTKSGKGKRTHADVRAAAQKNVAEWERDKHMGGKKDG